jgi:hypothetical protein
LDTGDEQKVRLKYPSRIKKNDEGRRLFLIFEKPSVENLLSLSLLDGL